MPEEKNGSDNLQAVQPQPWVSWYQNVPQLQNRPLNRLYPGYVIFFSGRLMNKVTMNDQSALCCLLPYVPWQSGAVLFTSLPVYVPWQFMVHVFTVLCVYMHEFAPVAAAVACWVLFHADKPRHVNIVMCTVNTCVNDSARLTVS